MFDSKKEYIYPKIWNDDDIIKFKYYLKEAKTMYDLPDDLIDFRLFFLFPDHGVPLRYDTGLPHSEPLLQNHPVHR